MLAARHAVYRDARQRNPRRWSAQTRNWTPVGVDICAASAAASSIGGIIT
jgi:hypothetical protein